MSLYAALTGRIQRIDSAQPNHFDEKSGTYIPGIQGRWGNKQMFGGVYFQDSWRVKPGLTVNYGLRWDFYGDMYHYPLTYSGPSVEDLWGPSGVENMFKPGTLTGSMSPMINVQPQHLQTKLCQSISQCWNRLVSSQKRRLAGQSAGRWEDRHPRGLCRYLFHLRYSELRQHWQRSLQLAKFRFDKTGRMDLYREAGISATLFHPLSRRLSPSLSRNPCQISLFLGRLLTTINPNIKSPHSRQWSFGIQREIVKNGVFEIRYVGNRTVDGWLSKEINEVNIFENGFLKEFQDAQNNLAIFRARKPELRRHRPTCLQFRQLRSSRPGESAYIHCGVSGIRSWQAGSNERVYQCRICQQSNAGESRLRGQCNCQ